MSEKLYWQIVTLLVSIAGWVLIGYQSGKYYASLMTGMLGMATMITLMLVIQTITMGDE